MNPKSEKEKDSYEEAIESFELSLIEEEHRDEGEIKQTKRT